MHIDEWEAAWRMGTKLPLEGLHGPFYGLEASSPRAYYLHIGDLSLQLPDDVAYELYGQEPYSVGVSYANPAQRRHLGNIEIRRYAEVLEITNIRGYRCRGAFDGYEVVALDDMRRQGMFGECTVLNSTAKRLVGRRYPYVRATPNGKIRPRKRQMDLMMDFMRR